ncbi:hypothetical protein KSU1_B0102 [Candidatus Jettenia caeni]|uniref:Uncharacterized protein n=1 Tax=Candidatus Jettenia caeni TaxID=247490 RepID=I3IGW4_9BACT|nr:MAG: hypothetical protein EDM77_10620 [Candidatus Jettenia sp. AMX1]GAB60959.1 hypothetical protein KSU1_B0102 [Candidatus Jettenia caeni]
MSLCGSIRRIPLIKGGQRGLSIPVSQKEIASDNALAMTGGVIFPLLGICLVSSLKYYSIWNLSKNLRKERV